MHVSHRFSVTLVSGVAMIIIGLIFLIGNDFNRPSNKDIYKLPRADGPFLTITDRYFVSNVGANDIHPIASITKLMTALVVYSKYTVNLAKDTVTIDSLSESQPGDIIRLRLGDTYRLKDLVKAMLVGSSNDAAYAVASHFGINAFISEMNKLAMSIGMKDSSFVNPTGLDQTRLNLSTPHDLAILLDYIYEQYPEILSSTKMSEFVLSDLGQENIMTIHNTDSMLSDRYLGPKIIGGKTGSTGEARQTLVIMGENRDRGGKPVVFVVLVSEDRFKAMKDMMDRYYGVKRTGQ